MSKRVGWLLVIVASILSALPALDLWRVLRLMNQDWVKAFSYPVFDLGIKVTGAWALIFLFLTLACSPVQRLLSLIWPGTRWPGSLRRTVGLFAFFYCLLHLLFYLAVGQKWRWDYVWEDAFLEKSRLPGWGAIFLLLPLALTSTDSMVRRLGGKFWKRLHFLVFPAIALAIWHQTWTEKQAGTNDYHRATYAMCAFGILILARLLPKLRRTIATRLLRAR
ncbi:MAG: ferric reductase-like transmembrane domain-containing protein [Polyangiaceae bacterium]